MRNKVKITIIAIIVLYIGLAITITFADEIWKMETEIDKLGYSHKIVVIENS